MEKADRIFMRSKWNINDMVGHGLRKVDEVGTRTSLTLSPIRAMYKHFISQGGYHGR